MKTAAGSLDPLPHRGLGGTGPLTPFPHGEGGSLAGAQIPEGQRALELMSLLQKEAPMGRVEPTVGAITPNSDLPPRITSLFLLRSGKRLLALASVAPSASGPKCKPPQAGTSPPTQPVCSESSSTSSPQQKQQVAIVTPLNPHKPEEEPSLPISHFTDVETEAERLKPSLKVSGRAGVWTELGVQNLGWILTTGNVAPSCTRVCVPVTNTCVHTGQFLTLMSWHCPGGPQLLSVLVSGACRASVFLFRATFHESFTFFSVLQTSAQGLWELASGLAVPLLMGRG